MPVGGYFRIQFSNYKNNVVKVTDQSSFKSNCFLVTDKDEDVGIECSPGFNIDEIGFIDIKCTATLFGDKGTPKEYPLKFKVTGLTNPRIKNELSFFRIFSMDSQHRIID